jgi:hypothetical protein
VQLGGGKAAGWVRAGSVLNVLAVLGNQGRSELEELLAQLGNELGANQVLHRLLLLAVGVDIDVELGTG